MKPPAHLAMLLSNETCKIKENMQVSELEREPQSSNADSSGSGFLSLRPGPGCYEGVRTEITLETGKEFHAVSCQKRSSTHFGILLYLKTNKQTKKSYSTSSQIKFLHFLLSPGLFSYFASSYSSSSLQFQLDLRYYKISTT